jgi:hypothetical protein
MARDWGEVAAATTFWRARENNLFHHEAPAFAKATAWQARSSRRFFESGKQESRKWDFRDRSLKARWVARSESGDERVSNETQGFLLSLLISKQKRGTFSLSEILSASSAIPLHHLTLQPFNFLTCHAVTEPA